MLSNAFHKEMQKGFRPHLPLPVADATSRAAANGIETPTPAQASLDVREQGSLFAEPNIQALCGIDNQFHHIDAFDRLQRLAKGLGFVYAELQGGDLVLQLEASSSLLKFHGEDKRASPGEGPQSRRASHREQHTIQGTRGTLACSPSGSTRQDISMVVTATSRFATKQHVVTQAQLALQPTHCLLHRAALCASSRSCDAVACIIEPGEISGNWVDSWNSSHNRGGCWGSSVYCRYWDQLHGTRTNRADSTK